MDKNEAMALRQNQMLQSMAKSEAEQATELKRAVGAMIETNKALRQMAQEMSKCTSAIYALIEEIKSFDNECSDDASMDILMEELSDDHR